jgi:hypothetical protein
MIGEFNDCLLDELEEMVTRWAPGEMNAATYAVVYLLHIAWASGKAGGQPLVMLWNLASAFLDAAKMVAGETETVPPEVSKWLSEHRAD